MRNARAEAPAATPTAVPTSRELDTDLADTVASVRAGGAEITGRIRRSALTHGPLRRDRELGD
ncbi:hypothetical protein WKY82_08320 [Gordonia malaquae]|uniref:hypothetical protein n=1 Tax=Gordonia malaquae TaxID=410332 RepID=UPI0030C7948D